MIKNTTGFCNPSSVIDGWCPCHCDEYGICWESIAPGQNVSNNCPTNIAGMVAEENATKFCNWDGDWDSFNRTNNTYGYTNYQRCLLPPLRTLKIMCSEFGGDTCKQIAQKVRHMEIVALTVSLISLYISLYIFSRYRVLKNNRTKIHQNLFIALILQVKVRLIFYIDEAIDPTAFIRNTKYVNEGYILLLEYAKTVMFMWMFIEGFYLHNMITVTVFHEYSYIRLYYIVGWTVPMILTFIWSITMLFKVSTGWEYYYFLPYFWILDGPRYFLIVINLMFLLNIIRVLVVKLQESHTSDIEQVRKAIRAAIFLLPLMGITQILFLIDYHFHQVWKFKLWMFGTYFLNTFQGFFVALIYCFLNEEVQIAVRNTIYLRLSLGTSCFNQLSCCKPKPKSPEESEIVICDLSDRGHNKEAVNLTMAETKLLEK